MDHVPLSFVRLEYQLDMDMDMSVSTNMISGSRGDVGQDIPVTCGILDFQG